MICRILGRRRFARRATFQIFPEKVKRETRRSQVPKSAEILPASQQRHFLLESFPVRRSQLPVGLRQC